MTTAGDAIGVARYPTLTRTRRLREGTSLFIPDTEGAGEGNRLTGGGPRGAAPKDINVLSDLPPPLHVLTEEEVVRVLQPPFQNTRCTSRELNVLVRTPTGGTGIWLVTANFRLVAV